MTCSKNEIKSCIKRILDTDTVDFEMIKDKQLREAIETLWTELSEHTESTENPLDFFHQKAIVLLYPKLNRVNTPRLGWAQAIKETIDGLLNLIKDNWWWSGKGHL